eukprot:1742315-Karenia_brevis.AAC.1
MASQRMDRLILRAEDAVTLTRQCSSPVATDHSNLMKISLRMSQILRQKQTEQILANVINVGRIP